MERTAPAKLGAVLAPTDPGGLWLRRGRVIPGASTAEGRPLSRPA